MKQIILILLMVMAAVAVQVVLANSVGPNDAGTFASNSPGDYLWNDPTFAHLSDNVYATATISRSNTTNGFSYFLNVSNFNFNVPAGATITGIVVGIERHHESDTEYIGSIEDFNITLLKNGIPTGQNKAIISTWETVDTSVTYGGENDLWGIGIEPADVNSPAMGVTIKVNQPIRFGVATAFIDHVNMTVYYTILSEKDCNVPPPGNPVNWSLPCGCTITRKSATNIDYLSVNESFLNLPLIIDSSNITFSNLNVTPQQCSVAMNGTFTFAWTPFPKDTTPPLITSNIDVSPITQNSGKINWITDEFSNSIVDYSTTPGGPYTRITNITMVKSHSVNVPALSTYTRYYFRISSVDVHNNTVQSSEQQFLTLPTSVSVSNTCGALCDSCGDVDPDTQFDCSYHIEATACASSTCRCDGSNSINDIRFNSSSITVGAPVNISVVYNCWEDPGPGINTTDNIALWYYNGTGWKTVQYWPAPLNGCDAIVGSAVDTDGNVSYEFTPDQISGIHYIRAIESRGFPLSNTSNCTSLSFGDTDDRPFNVTVGPRRVNGQPTGTLPSGTIQATLSLNTDEPASCRYSPISGRDYSIMTPLTNTGGISHSVFLSGLSGVNTYNYYIKCRNPIGATNLDDYKITFSIA